MTAAKTTQREAKPTDECLSQKPGATPTSLGWNPQGSYAGVQSPTFCPRWLDLDHSGAAHILRSAVEVSTLQVPDAHSSLLTGLGMNQS